MLAFLFLLSTYQAIFPDRVCAIGEFICDTPVHKGQMGVTVATNFGTKLAINAYKCASTRDNENAVTYNGVFVVDQSKEDIFDCNGLRDVAMAPKFWSKVGHKIPKNYHNFGCKQHVHAEFGFEIGFVPSGNSSVTLPYTRDKEVLP